MDYIGIFDDVARALDFDEKAVQRVVSNIDELCKALPVQMQQVPLVFFAGVDRTVGGYEGLSAARQCLPNTETRDTFAAEYSVLGHRYADSLRLHLPGGSRCASSSQVAACSFR